MNYYLIQMSDLDYTLFIKLIHNMRKRDRAALFTNSAQKIFNVKGKDLEILTELNLDVFMNDKGTSNDNSICHLLTYLGYFVGSYKRNKIHYKIITNNQKRFPTSDINFLREKLSSNSTLEFVSFKDLENELDELNKTGRRTN